MTRVTAWIFHQVLLMVIFSGIKFPDGRDLHRDGSTELARFRPLLLHAVRDLFLSFTGIKDRRTILGADVIMLAI